MLPLVYVVAGGRIRGAKRAGWVTWALSAQSATNSASSAISVKRQGRIGKRHVQPEKLRMDRQQWKSKGSSMRTTGGRSSTRRSRSPWRASTQNRMTSASSSAAGSRPITLVPTDMVPRMDAELVEMVETRPEILLKFLLHIRVETFSDLKGLWRSSLDFVRELEDFAEQRLPADEAMQMATFWTTASSRATASHNKLVRMLIQDRQSSYRTSSTAPTATPVLASSIPSRVKRLIATGQPGPPATTVSLAAVDPHTQEEDKKRTKLDIIFQIAMEDVMNLDQLGVTWEMLEDAMVLQSTKDVVLANASRLGLGRLSSLIAAFRRWKRHAVETGVEINKPLPIQVAHFLKKVGQGGPTAASSQYQAMLWWQKSMGAELPMEHWLVTPWRLHSASHQGAQATELPPWEFLNLLRWTTTLQGTHQLLASFLLMVAVSCVRYEHIQRSKFIQKHDGWLEMYCPQGKARKQGTRPGYGWSVADIQWKGFSLCAILADFFHNEALSENFLIPAIELQASDLWEISRDTPLVLNKAMSRGRFLEIFRGSLLQINVEPQTAARAQFNRLRRFLPTAGNVAQLQPMEMQAVGNWIDIPAGGGGEPGATKPRAVMHMGLHYAGQKVARSFVVKAHALKIFMSLFRRRQGEFALDEQGLLIRGSWEWPEVSAMFELYKGEFSEVQPPEESKPLQDQAEEEKDVVVLEVIPAPQVELPVEQPEVGDPAEEDQLEEALSVAESDSSISASDLSAEGQDLLDIVTDSMDFTETPWLQQGQKIHLIRETTAEGHLVPWCRDMPFAQAPRKSGAGFDSLVHDRTCQRCLARMPRSLMAALAEHAGWQY